MAITVPAYHSGDTVRFSVTFRDYPADPDADPSTGDLLDPESVEVTIFNAELVEIASGTGSNTSTGVYTFDYTMPDEPGSYFVEWKGMINSKPEIKRDKFKVKFYVGV